VHGGREHEDRDDVDPAVAARVLSMLESMTDAYLALDRQGHITYVNREAERALGRDRGELVGHALTDVFPQPHNPAFGRAYRRALTTGEIVELEAEEPNLKRWFQVRASPMDDGLTVFFRDVTELHRARREQARARSAEERATRSAQDAMAHLEHLATHDDLTGLPNRRALTTWLDDRLDRGTRGRALAVCLLDLDRFKLVNESLGHTAGDSVLAEMATRLTSVLRHGDLVARVGGDEFVVVLEGASRAEVDTVVHRILEAVRAPLDLLGRELVMTTSVGIAFAEDRADSGSLLRDADIAMYQAKEQGRNRASRYDQELQGTLVRRLGIETDLRRALKGGELLLHYQPNVELRTGRPAGLEALVRWQHPELGLLSPVDFVPVAEESELIVELCDEVLRLGLDDARRWLDGDRVLGGRLWVNVSGRELETGVLPEQVRAALDASGLPAACLGIEATETALLRDPIDAGRVLEELVADGVAVAIDDFGTGYSSLARLAAFPFQMLKIDRSFTVTLDDHPANPLVDAVVRLGDALGATVCAEGVETAAQARALRDLDADLAAGFHLAPPVPAEQVLIAADQASEALQRAVGGA
jgi:diguanylate cyclase (GGDEF)-like protein/PAS domain S-box-containing protein